jgi:hypothetical protein
MGLSESDFNETKLLSPAKMEKVLNKDDLALIMELCIKSTAPNVVCLETDNRQAVETCHDAFEAVITQSLMR